MMSFQDDKILTKNGRKSLFYLRPFISAVKRQTAKFNCRTSAGKQNLDKISSKHVRPNIQLLFPQNMNKTFQDFTCLSYNKFVHHFNLMKIKDCR